MKDYTTPSITEIGSLHELTLAPGNNGSIAPMLLGQCKIALTRQRIQDLAAQIRCPGGDLSCSP